MLAKAMGMHTTLLDEEELIGNLRRVLPGLEIHAPNYALVEMFLRTPQWSRTESADGAASVPTYFTIILQSSVGTLEGHSEVGVYLASFCVPN